MSEYKVNTQEPLKGVDCEFGRLWDTEGPQKYQKEKVHSVANKLRASEGGNCMGSVYI